VNENAIWSDEQRALVLEEMDRILADPTFKSSKRCQGMLIRLINSALAGDFNGLKERTLGVEAFGRDPNYDTNNDPIVRTTATEIRKRLAQWYGEPNRPHSVRIRLVPGSYLPEFDFENQDQPKETAEEKALEEKGVEDAVSPSLLSQPAPPSVIAVQPPGTRRALRKWVISGAAILLLIAAIFLSIRPLVKPSKELMIWQPFLDNTKPLTLSIADTDFLVGSGATGDMHWQIIANAIESREAPRDASNNKSGSPSPNTPFLDARVAQKISVFLGAHGRMPVLRDSSSLNLGDFHRGPVVLIDAFNPWSVVLLSNPNLRYSVRIDPASHNIWIRDAQNPTTRAWEIDGNTDHHSVDYAVITRFFDNETNEWVLGLCGLWSYGTEAAANLLVEPEFFQLLPDSLGSAKNFQIVVKTSVINGNTGVPQILAVYTW
jgi:hypothetical protein